MIRRLYVDNFKSLVDFEWQPDFENLVIGVNGSGKTAALEAIEILRTWACDWPKNERWFDADDVTRWSDSKIVSFELELESSGLNHKYSVKFDCTSRDGVPRASIESLNIEGETIFARELDDVLYKTQGENFASFPLPTSQSALAALSTRSEFQSLRQFRRALEAIINVRPLPHLISDEARNLEQRIGPHFENFVSWYLTASGSTLMIHLPDFLRNVWPEFDHLNLEQLGKAYVLSAVFQSGQRSRGMQFAFSELSDGEKMLIVLYAVASYQRSSPGTSIILDEPDNFLALGELQPWLIQLLDDRPTDGQIILVSHNSEIVNTMGEHRVSLFERSDHISPTTVRSIEAGASGLPFSELLTRGWLTESTKDRQVDLG